MIPSLTLRVTISGIVRMGRTFQASIAALVKTAQALSIAIVALLPWLGVFLVFLIPVVLLARALAKRFGRREKAIEAQVIESPAEKR